MNGEYISTRSSWRWTEAALPSRKWAVQRKMVRNQIRDDKNDFYIWEPFMSGTFFQKTSTNINRLLELFYWNWTHFLKRCSCQSSDVFTMCISL